MVKTRVQRLRVRSVVVGGVVGLLAAVVVPVAVSVAPVAADPAQVTERVSVNSAGVQGYLGSGPSVSSDGRFVAFGAVLPGFSMVAQYVRDRDTGVTEMVSVDGATQYSSGSHAMTRDGRYVAFTALGVVGLRDRVASATEVVSYSSGGVPTTGGGPAISDDARYIVFSSSASNVVASDTNAADDVFVRDRVTATNERVSVSSGGVEGDGASSGVAISGDGRYVAFASNADNLVAGDTNGVEDLFVRDRQNATTERVGLGCGSPECVWPCFACNGISDHFAISGDGRFVAFGTGASLVPEDTDSYPDVYVYDRTLHVTKLASVTTSGSAAGLTDGYAAISDDGRKVVFRSYSPDVVAGDTNGAEDVFVRDLVSQSTERVSVSSTGAESHPLYSGASGGDNTIAITGDGSVVAFASSAPDLVAGDTNGDDDAFVRGLPNAPLASIATPKHLGFYAVGQTVPASFSCSPGAAAVVSCAGSTANGALVDTSTPGVFTYDLTATDAAGKVNHVSAQYTVLAPTSASASVGVGGSVSTDPGGVGATALAPLTATVTTPNAGTVSLATGVVSTPTPSGYTLLGLQFQITAPPASAAAPLVLVFDVDSTFVENESWSDVTFLKDGAQVPDCLGETEVPVGLTACVTDRVASPLDDQDLRLTIISTSASTWNLVAGSPVPPVITAGATAGAEGNSGTHTVMVPVTLSAPSAVSVSAAWSTQNQSATAGSDYAAASGTVSFAPGQTTTTIAVTVNGDTTVEADETFRIALANPSNGTIGGSGFGVVTIINDDQTAIGFRITTTSLPNGHLGAAYAKTLTAAGGVAPYKWKKLTKLPKGLKLNTKTGLISGTPKKQKGTFTVTVQAGYKTKVKHQRAVKHNAFKTFTIVVT